MKKTLIISLVSSAILLCACAATLKYGTYSYRFIYRGIGYGGVDFVIRSDSTFERHWWTDVANVIEVGKWTRSGDTLFVRQILDSSFVQGLTEIGFSIPEPYVDTFKIKNRGLKGFGTNGKYKLKQLFSLAISDNFHHRKQGGDEKHILVPVRKLQSLRSRIMVHTSTHHASASLAHFAAPVPQIPAGHKTGNRPEPNGPGNLRRAP